MYDSKEKLQKWQSKNMWYCNVLGNGLSILTKQLLYKLSKYEYWTLEE